MTNDISILKNRLRTQILNLAAMQKEKQLQAWSSGILKSVEELEEFQKARIILIYMSIVGEVPTRDFIDKWSESKTFVLPKVVSPTEMELRKYSSEHLVCGAFGIQEPDENCELVDPQHVELALIPGLAFAPISQTPAHETYQGKFFRLGRGKGYYDRLLTKLNCPKIGICYPYNIVQEIPHDSMDQPVDKCLFGGVNGGVNYL